MMETSIVIVYKHHRCTRTESAKIKHQKISEKLVFTWLLLKHGLHGVAIQKDKVYPLCYTHVFLHFKQIFYYFINITTVIVCSKCSPNSRDLHSILCLNTSYEHGVSVTGSQTNHSQSQFCGTYWHKRATDHSCQHLSYRLMVETLSKVHLPEWKNGFYSYKH